MGINVTLYSAQVSNLLEHASCVITISDQCKCWNEFSIQSSHYSALAMLAWDPIFPVKKTEKDEFEKVNFQWLFGYSLSLRHLKLSRITAKLASIAFNGLAQNRMSNTR